MKNYIDCSFNSKIAEAHGVVAALLMNRIIWSIEIHSSRNQEEFFIDYKWWMYDTAASFHAQYSFVSLNTINRAIKRLETSGLLISKQMNASKWKHTKWYAVNEEEYYRLLFEVEAKSIDSPPVELPKMGKQDLPKMGKQDLPKMGKSSLLNSQTSNLHNNQDNALSALTPSALCVTDSNESTLKELEQPNNDAKRRTLSTDIPKVAKPIKKESTSWEPFDDFSEVFGNLNKLSVCKVKFKTEEYRDYLLKVMEESKLTIKDLIKISDQWQEHHNEATKKPVSPKSSLRTWINNYVTRRDKFLPKASKPKPGDIDYDYGQ